MDDKTSGMRFNEAASGLGRLSGPLSALPETVKAQAHEIRLRLGRPVMVSLPGGDVFVTEAGGIAYLERTGLLKAEKRDMEESFRKICSSSVYAHQQEIKNGFVVLPGGHRAGLCGTAVVENGKVVNLRDISSINLRIAREIKGAADGAAACLIMDGMPCGGLVFGPPGCGKTTVLRDLARQFSLGIRLSRRARVAVVDERGEIAASFAGRPQNDLGPCCDVLDGYPKGEGIMQAVRSLSPDVILCDEIGGDSDAVAVLQSLNAGVPVIASAHARNLNELTARRNLVSLLKSGAFQRAVQLGGRETPGCVAAIYKEGDWHVAENGGTGSDFYRMFGGGRGCRRKAVQAREPA